MLRLRQVAERLNISVSGVHALVEKGLLPVICTGAGGKGYRVTEDDLAAFIESRRKGREPQPWPERTRPIRRVRRDWF